MFEIKPNTGIGRLEYGMRLESVKEVMGSECVYEEWMGGNLNDSLFYSGIIIGFRPFDMHGPLPGSKVIEFHLNENLPASLFGESLFDMNGVDLMALLREKEFTPYQSRPYFVECEEMHIHFDLDEQGKVCFVEM